MVLKSVHILISGSVQGVGFRAYVIKKAKSFDVKGWVRNIVDGRVEVLATANEENLNKFVSELHIGPSFAVVKDISQKEVFKLKTDNTFAIESTASKTWSGEEV